MKKSNQYICIAELSTSSDAHILRGLLETEDIEVFIFNEGFASLTPAYTVAMGGIKLHIPLMKKEKADPVVESYFNNLKIENHPKCSNCGSVNLKHDYTEHLKYTIHAIVAVSLGANVSRGRRVYKKCLDCRYRY
ncbi:MAG: DUF2007 domain-containing protein [Sulfurovum sp.]|nr:DUF2007 domain-containing protein [Sulfurovum sp.]